MEFARNARSFRRALARLSFVGIALCVSACSTSGEVVAPTEDPAFTRLLASTVEEAQSGGASDAQLALLDEASKIGLVSPEIMKQAIGNVADCVTAVGLGFEWGEPTGPSSLPFFNYGISVPTDVDESLMRECDAREVVFVSQLCQLQPAMERARRELIAGHLDAVVECLQEAGVAIDDDATVDEIRPAVNYAAFGITPGSADPPPANFHPTDCAAAVGLSMTDFGY